MHDDADTRIPDKRQFITVRYLVDPRTRIARTRRLHCYYLVLAQTQKIAETEQVLLELDPPEREIFFGFVHSITSHLHQAS